MLNYIKTTQPRRVIAIGNPPYQEEDPGFGRSAKPIYNKVVEALLDASVISQVLVVIPARWFSGGKGLDKFRAKITHSNKVREICYFERSKAVFPTVEISGGVCFLYYDKKFCGLAQIKNQKKRSLFALDKYDIIVPHKEALPILEKVLSRHKGKFLDQVVWARNPFGIECHFFKKNPRPKKGSVACLAYRKAVHHIAQELVLKNQNKIPKFKVAFPNAVGNSSVKTLPRPAQFFIVKPGQITTETYSIAGSFNTKKEAENFLYFLQSYLARFLLGLRKPTHHTSKKSFLWVPFMSTKMKWTDEKLFKHFGILKKEQSYIINQVHQWTP